MMSNNHKIICKCIGGSHLYKLNTEQSDTDYRSVFLNTDIGSILGINRFEEQTLNDHTNDEQKWELKKFLRMVQKGNTQSLDLLHNDNWLVCTEEFKLIQKHIDSLINSKQIYRSLKGYLQGERKFAKGTRTGKLGSKRHQDIVNLGFSPKNFASALRLCITGYIFFTEDQYPLDMSDFPILKKIKTNPEEYTCGYLSDLLDRYEKYLDEAYQNRVKTYKFDSDAANKICLECYKQFL